MRIFYHRLEHFSFLVERGTLFSRIESQNLRLDQEGRVASRLEFHGAGCANKSNIFPFFLLRDACRRNIRSRGGGKREDGPGEAS